MIREVRKHRLLSISIDPCARQTGVLQTILSGYQMTAGTAIHEGLHALGVGGSRRAEALVRLSGLENIGVAIDRRAMRQVLTDMSDNYNTLPWRSGGSTPNFPGLGF